MPRRSRAGRVPAPPPVELPTVHLARDVPRALAARRLADGAWARVRRGAYVDAGVTEGLDRFAASRRTALARVAAVGLTFGDVVLSHSSAALLWGLPLLTAHDRVHVVGRWSGNARTSPDVVRHLLRLDADDVVVRAGLRTTSLVRTVVDCATTLEAAGGLVVADAALAVGADVAACRHRLERLGPVRGVRTARAVLSVADDGAESPGESLARLAVLRLGLPAPQTQVRVATDDGDYWGDLGWPAWQVMAEYDGRAKYTARGTAADAVLAEKRRQEAMEEAGWCVLRLTSADLRAPERLRRRLARVLPPEAFGRCDRDLYP